MVRSAVSLFRFAQLATSFTLMLSSMFLAGCRGSGSGAAPPGADPAHTDSRARCDVVLVTIDTWRYDATGFSGAGRVKTPTLDRLASSGVIFDSAHAHAVLTLPSHATILTGLYPYQHGIHDNAGFRLRKEIPTLASVLRRAGYVTGAFVSAFPLDRRFGLTTGFDVYDDEYEGFGREGAFSFPERPGEVTVARAKGWWDSNRGARRFLWVHLFTPHFPYTPSEPFSSSYRAAPYYGEVALADAQLAPLLGPFLDGRESQTIIVVTADHGESLGEHHEQTHGLFAYESTLKVPLVFWAPGMIRAERRKDAARHVDIVPTILDLIELDAPSGLPGRALFRPADPASDSGSYFEALEAYLNRGWAPLHGRIEGGKKAISLPIPELYALDRDPNETTNLAAQQPKVYEAIVRRLPEETRQPIERESVSREVIEKLRSLGYVAGSAVPAPPDELWDEANDPKRLLDVDSAIDRAILQYEAGDADGSIKTLERVIEKHPRMAAVYSHLSGILMERGRTSEVVRLLSRATSMGIATEAMRARLALGLLQTGRPQEAYAALAGLGDSSDPEIQGTRGQVAEALGRPDEARTSFEKALELDPTDAWTHTDLGVLLMAQGRTKEARVHLERAVGLNSHIADAWNALGMIRAKEGDLRGAIDAWSRAGRIDPSLTEVWLNLGIAFQRYGDTARAVQSLERYASLVQGAERDRTMRMIETLKRRAGG